MTQLLIQRGITISRRLKGPQGPEQLDEFTHTKASTIQLRLIIRMYTIKKGVN